jgi:hypothetical protein
MEKEVFFRNLGYFYQDVFGARETLFLENMSLIISGTMSPVFNFCFIAQHLSKKDFEVLEKTWHGPMIIATDIEKTLTYQKQFGNLGFQKYTSFPILYKKIEEQDLAWGKEQTKNVQDIEVKLVDDQDRLKDFCFVVASTYNINEKIILNSMKKDILENNNSNLYVGYFNKKPISTIASLNHNNKGFVWNMAIVSEYRKLNFMKKMGYRMLKDNFNSNVLDMYTFTTAEETDGLFKKMGAKEIGDICLWIRK